MGADARTDTFTDARGNTSSTVYTLTNDTSGAINSLTTTGPSFTGAPAGSNVTSIVYNPDINHPSAVSLLDPLYNLGLRPSPWQSNYDALGNLTSSTDPLNHTWQFGYNANGTELISTTDPTNVKWQFFYGENGYPASHLTHVTDPAGATQATLAYNAFGQPSSVTVPAAVSATGTNEQTQFVYNVVTGDLTSVLNALGDTLTVNSYDLLGDPLSSSVYPDTGNPATSTTPLTTSLVYSAAQQVTQMTSPNGVQVNNAWTNGILTQIQTNAPPGAGGSLLAQTNFNYDSRGRLYKATDLVGTTAQYRFDKNSNLTKILDGNGNITRSTFGPDNEPTGVVWPDGHTTSRQYDAAGRLSTTIDERSIVTNYLYDYADRLTDIQFPAYASQNVHITYDSANRPLTVTDATGSRQYNYDSVYKRLQSVVTTISALPAGHNTFTVSYGYSGDGKLTSMTSPVGVTQYGYNAVGQLNSLTDPANFTTTWGYDHAGRIIDQLSVGGSIETDYNWTTSGLTGDPSTAPAYLGSIHFYINGSDQKFGGFGLQHSYLGQILKQTRTGTATVSNTTEAYTYDLRGRLAFESQTFPGRPPTTNTGTYSYDLANNLQGGSGGWTYNTSNQVTAAPAYNGMPGATGLSYDAAGDITGLNGATLTYDNWGRLSGAGGATYTYDSSGRRVSKTVSGQTTYYLYSGNQLIAALDSNGNVVQSYTWGALGLLSDSVGGQTRYYLYDGLGNTRILIGSGGNIIGNGTYTAWGRLSSGAFPSNMAFGWKGRYGVCTDSETGLMYMGARYYAPVIGRFLSRDPIGFAGGINLYAYCGGDPINYADPHGLNGGQLSFNFVEEEVVKAPTVATTVEETVAEVGTAVTEGVEAGGASSELGPGAIVVALGVTGVQAGLDAGNAIGELLFGENGLVKLPGQAEIEAEAAQPVLIASNPHRVSSITKADTECSLEELQALAGPAEREFRRWLEAQGIRLVPKAGVYSRGPDATPVGDNLPPWAFAEFKHDSGSGVKDGCRDIRHRFRDGYPAPAQIYLWRYDGTNFSFTPYGGLRYPRDSDIIQGSLFD